MGPLGGTQNKKSLLLDGVDAYLFLGHQQVAHGDVVGEHLKGLDENVGVGADLQDATIGGAHKQHVTDGSIDGSNTLKG